MLVNFGKKFIIFFLFLSAVLFSRQCILAYNFASDSGLSTTAVEAGYNSSNIQTPEYWVGQIIELVLGLLGIIFLALMIYAGFTWMTAAGNEQKAEKAKNVVVESIIGLTIVVAAYAITYFISSYMSTLN